MARLADSNLVCMDDGAWHVWGPVRRFPDEADVKKAEEALRTLWRARIAVPAYNYGSWQGCLEYCPWSDWRAKDRPTLDSPCFTTDYAEMDRRIYAKAGKEEDGEEQEEDEDAQVRQVRSARRHRPEAHRHVGDVLLFVPRLRQAVQPADDGARPRGGLL